MAKQTSVPAKSKSTPVENTIDIIDGAYQLVNIKPINVNTGIGNFNLDNLTTEQAEALIEIGCSWIRKK